MTKLKLMDNGHMSISGSDKKNLELGISRSTMDIRSNLGRMM